MSRYVGLCSCGRQYHGATEAAVRKQAKDALDSGHDVTIWQFAYGLAGRDRSQRRNALVPASRGRLNPRAESARSEDADA